MARERLLWIRRRNWRPFTGSALDELAGLAGEREAPGEDAPKAPAVDLHILKKLEGRRCQLEFTEENTIDAVMDGLLNNANVRILEVGERRVRIEYERKKEDAMFQKETVGAGSRAFDDHRCIFCGRK